ncbi:MAG TPA: hypothetical protein VF902_01540 [Coriobacteriia bacterium]
MATDDVMRFFALWMLTHETADEGLKAAVERGAKGGSEGMTGGPDAFVDGLSAMVAEEKEKLKAELAAGSVQRPDADEQRVALDELRFEVAAVRGRVDEMVGMLETVLAKLGAPNESAAPGGPGSARG